MINPGEFVKFLNIFKIRYGGGSVTFPITMAQGGSGASLTPVDGGLIFSNATTMEVLPTANNGVLVTDGSGQPSISGTLPLGILLAGNAAAQLAPVTLQQLQAAVQNETPACYVAEPTIDAFSTWTYDNGTAGVGSTLTAPANGATTIDGLDPVDTDGKRLFIAFENSNPAHNGVYDIAQGDGSNPTVFTRAADYDQPSEITFGDVLTVVLGDTLFGSFWQLTAEVNTIGTDPITFQRLTNTGALLKANNLSDLTSVSAARTALGLGNMALQAASLVAITGGTATLDEVRFNVNYTEIVGDLSLAAADANEAFVFTAGPFDLDADVGLAAFENGFVFYLKNQSASPCTFTPKAGEFIDGAASLTLQPGESYEIMKTSTEWSVVSNFNTSSGSASSTLMLMGA